MALRLGDLIPDFRAESTQGTIALHDYIDGRWAILFSHPNDFTPVCTTELATVARLMPEFRKRGVQVLALSCNDVLSHMQWIKDIESIAEKDPVIAAIGLDSDSTLRGSQSKPDSSHIGKPDFSCNIDTDPKLDPTSDARTEGSDSTSTGSEYMPKGVDSTAMVSYPIVSDPDRTISTRLGILDPDEVGPHGSSLSARAVLVLGPDKKLKASILYPASTGRNFVEILRVIDSLQLTANYSVATPVDWTNGAPCMVLPTVSDAVAHSKFPKGFRTIPVPSAKGYLRVTPQPNL